MENAKIWSGSTREHTIIVKAFIFAFDLERCERERITLPPVWVLQSFATCVDGTDRSTEVPAPCAKHVLTTYNLPMYTRDIRE